MNLVSICLALYEWDAVKVRRMSKRSVIEACGLSEEHVFPRHVFGKTIQHPT